MLNCTSDERQRLRVSVIERLERGNLLAVDYDRVMREFSIGEIGEIETHRIPSLRRAFQAAERHDQ